MPINTIDDKTRSNPSKPPRKIDETRWLLAPEAAL
jgi:hypothetical protein